MVRKNPIFIIAFLFAIVAGLLVDFDMPGTAFAFGFFSFILLFVWAISLGEKASDKEIAALTSKKSEDKS